MPTACGSASGSLRSLHPLGALWLGLRTCKALPESLQVLSISQPRDSAVPQPFLRWAVGFLCVLPVALVLCARWPKRNDWPAVAALGICFFGLFFIFYNIAVAYTTAARASLALSTLPLQTMLVGAAPCRAADMAQVRRRRYRHSGRFCSACLRPFRGSTRCVAR